MNNSPSPSDTVISSTEILLDTLLREMEQSWEEWLRQGRPADRRPALVESCLERFSDPRNVEPLVVLRLIRAEFALRERCGDKPSSEDYARRFPEAVRQAEGGVLLLGVPAMTTGPQHAAVSTVSPKPETLMESLGIPVIVGYEVLEKLGEGTYAVVYRARQVLFERDVALKVFKGAIRSSDALEQFFFEARAVARSKHAGIIDIFDGEADHDPPYLVMEYVKGRSLWERINNGMLFAPDEAAQLVEIMARAIHVAHQCGIVHRDLKPANILLTEAGLPKVADFGLAGLRADHGITKAGQPVGSPLWMSPEQVQGKEPSPSMDVYGLGAVLYHMLTGRPPFLGATPQEVCASILNDDLFPVRLFAPKVDRDLEAICFMCLRRASEKRYSSAEALAEDLKRFRERRPVQARPLSFPVRAVKWVRRNPLPTALALALIVAAGLGVFLVNEKTVSDLKDQNAYKAQRLVEETQRHADETQKRSALISEFFRQNRKQVVELANELARRASPGENRQRRTHEQILAYYKNVASQLEGEPSLELALIYDEWGELAKIFGFTEQAESRFARAADIFRILVQASPDDREHRTKLGVTLRQRGILLLELGDPQSDPRRRASLLGQAEQELEESRKVFEPLTVERPNSLSYRLGLAEALHSLALVYDARLDREKCLEYHADAIRHRKLALAAASKRRFTEFIHEAKRDLARSHGYRGDVYVARGQYPEAEEDYREARRLRSQLVEALPADASVRFQNARGIANMGRLHDNQGQADRAIREYTKAVEEHEKIVTMEPAVTEYRRDLGFDSLTLAELQLDGNDAGKARPRLERARLEYVLLGAEQSGPGSPDRMGLFRCRVNLAKASLGQTPPDLAGGKAHLEEAEKFLSESGDASLPSWALYNAAVLHALKWNFEAVGKRESDLTSADRQRRQETVATVKSFLARARERGFTNDMRVRREIAFKPLASFLEFKESFRPAKH